MSRLDDELKLAFGRVEPSPDFTERVLKALDSSPAPEKSLWQSLIGAFRLPRIRWVAAAAASSLLVVIGVLQYWQPRPAQQMKEVASVNTQPTPEPVSNGPAETLVSPQPSRVKDISASGSNNEIHAKNTRNNNRQGRRSIKRIRSAEEIAAEAEGQIAKERLLLALRIASTTLNEAQKVIRGDDEQPKPEPATRR